MSELGEKLEGTGREVNFERTYREVNANWLTETRAELIIRARACHSWL